MLAAFSPGHGSINTEVDETQLCWWGTRLQLLGWIEQDKGRAVRGEAENEREREKE